MTSVMGFPPRLTLNCRPVSTPQIALPFLNFFFPVGLLLFLVSGRSLEIVAFFSALYCAAWWVWVRGVKTNAPLKSRSIAVAIAVFAVVVAGDNLFMMLVVWLGVVVLYISVSPIASYIYGALPIALTCGVHIYLGSGLPRIIAETLTVTTLIASGITLASLTQRMAQGAADQRSLAISQERERIARTLHDALGHRLTSVSMSLAFAERAWDSPRAREEISRARESLRVGLNEMRTVVRALHPVTTDEGFEETLHSLGESFASTGLDVSISGESRFSPKEEQLLLAVTQEALTNTIRHSNANHVTITLDDRKFTYSDNGSGCTQLKEGFGLRSLRERIEAIGGTLVVLPHPSFSLEVRL